MLARLKTDRGRLAVLTLLHFSVDFCGGITIPLAEPTLVNHLSVGLPRIAFLLGGCALIINVIQPVSGAVLPRRGLPILLLLAPLAALFTSTIGLTRSFWATAVMLAVAGVGIGIVHPEAALAAHSAAGKRKGLGVSIFMSGGYFGFATGSLIGGVWAECQGLRHFWLLAIPALTAAVLVYLSDLHRYEGQAEEDKTAKSGQVNFAPVLALSVSIAASMCLLVRLITILLVRRFPGQDGQGWGGATVFATGITGALGAFLWGYLSERWTRGRTVAIAQLLCVPFLYGLLHASRPDLVPFWGLGVGFTLGGTFAVSVVLARESRGLSQRLRMGLAIGGAWGMGEAAFIVAGEYIGRFPDGDPVPVARSLNSIWVLMGVIIVIGLVLSRAERRARTRATETAAEITAVT